MRSPAGGCLLVLLLAAGEAAAQTYQGNPDNYQTLLRQLRPGDTLVLAPGEYRRGLSLSKLCGQADRPIVIEGRPGAEPPVFPGRGGHNTFQLNGCSHLVLRHLKLDGRNIPAVHAVDARGGGHHVTLEGLVIVNHGATQQTCGLAANDGRHYWNWTVRGCTMIGPGTGMYLGNNGGSGGFSTALIENNLILDSVGYCIEFKVQNGRPEEAPEGPTVIRHNVFSKIKSESGGRDDGARPNLLVDPFPPSGRGSNDMYLVYGNFFYQNYESDALFQGTGNVALYSNVMVNEKGSRHAVHIQAHNGRNRKVRVFFNTIVAGGNGIRVGSTEGEDHHVFGNAVFAGRPLGLSGSVKAAGNVTGSCEDAARHLAAPFAALGELDLHPKPGALAGAGFDASAVRDLPDWNLDFDGAKRTAAVCGAYAGAAGPDSWKLARARKDRAPAAAPAPAEPPPVAAKPPAPAEKESPPPPPPASSAPPPPARPPTPEEICRGWLSLAKSYQKMGMTEEANEYFRKIIAACPDSACAAEARQELPRR